MLERQSGVFGTVVFNIHMFTFNKHLLSIYCIPGAGGAGKTNLLKPSHTCGDFDVHCGKDIIDAQRGPGDPRAQAAGPDQGPS